MIDRQSSAATAIAQESKARAGRHDVFCIRPENAADARMDALYAGAVKSTGGNRCGGGFTFRCAFVVQARSGHRG